ncbi:helix-turn-helix transcriptional regulator [Nonomuraea recticatena]
MVSTLLSGSLGFARLLRSYRCNARLSQEQLAERARLSVRALRDIERGITRFPRRSSVRRLAVALELTGEDRLSFESAPDRALASPLAGPGYLALDRTALLQEVDDAITAAARAGTSGVVSVTGPPGAGKTAFAERCADVLRARRGLACFGVDLRGERQEADAAMRHVAAARGVLVLDGARCSDLLAPLLELGFSGVIITSRHPLKDLSPARHIVLTVLP